MVWRDWIKSCSQKSTLDNNISLACQHLHLQKLVVNYTLLGIVVKVSQAAHTNCAVRCNNLIICVLVNLSWQPTTHLTTTLDLELWIWASACASELLQLGIVLKGNQAAHKNFACSQNAATYILYVAWWLVRSNWGWQEADMLQEHLQLQVLVSNNSSLAMM